MHNGWMLEPLADLLFPSQCVICHRLPKTLCDECGQRLDFDLHPVKKESLSGKALLYYDENSADLLNAFKERGQLQIAKRLIAEIIERVQKPEVDFLAPAPSSNLNFAKRGFAPADYIAKQLSKQWHIPLVQVKLLRQLGDQSTLGRAERLGNLQGAMISPHPLAERRVLLIDDIVTTGATLLELARAVTEAGGQVCGFLAIAETFPRRATKTSKKV